MNTKKKINKLNRYCSRCHGTYAKQEFTEDDRICNTCLSIRAKGKMRKGKEENDEAKFAEVFGSAGIFL